MASEDQLINRVRRALPTAGSGLRVGIGDDAAVISAPARSAERAAEWVVTTDAFLEDVHFLRGIHPPRAVGYKALARATSDLAAMGAAPRFFFLTLALPPECTKAWLDGFLAGMALAARRFGLVLAGGDTTNYPKVLMSLTIIGEVAHGQAILRSGAQVGDLIYVSGRLGEAELGLHLILDGRRRGQVPRSLLAKHLYPEPRLELGKWLVARKSATAMIDTSDGLSTDLGHLCKASGVGARIWADNIPAVRIPPGLQRLGLKPLDFALHGGDDYELLFTVPKAKAKRLPAEVGGTPITPIGEITPGKQIVLVDSQGTSIPLRPQGWDPFRKRDRASQ